MIILGIKIWYLFYAMAHFGISVSSLNNVICLREQCWQYNNKWLGFLAWKREARELFAISCEIFVW